MTEQTRPTDTNEAAETLRAELSHWGGPSYGDWLDAALDWERRRTVERFREAANTTDHPSRTNDEIVAMLRAILTESEALNWTIYLANRLSRPSDERVPESEEPR